ncbi:hypothetical protein HZF02_32605 (plasmid) [Pseudomonas yamanorum]|nr:hypothetical protein HZF02_32605 [Pseudomonas yamanorum]
MSGHGIQHNLTDLIDTLASAPVSQAPMVSKALYEYLLELLDEQVLEGREYSYLSEHQNRAFLDLANLNSAPAKKTNGKLLHITDAIELLDKISNSSNPEQEIDCECDIGVFIDRVYREVKLGLAEEIELDFYRRWLSRALFNRPFNNAFFVD